MAEDTETIFQSLSEDFGKGDLDDVGKRRRLAAKARRLVSSLETDHDIVLDMFFGVSHQSRTRSSMALHADADFSAFGRQLSEDHDGSRPPQSLGR